VSRFALCRKLFLVLRCENQTIDLRQLFLQLASGKLAITVTRVRRALNEPKDTMTNDPASTVVAVAYSPREASRAMRPACGERAIRKAIRSGELRVARIGVRTYVPHAELERWIAAATEELK
jgi:hypothetical protein